LGALQGFGIEKVSATLIRRSADPNDIKTGPINALVPDVEIPSHHAVDVQTVLPINNIMTIAVKASTTLMHLHSLAIELREKQDEDAIINAFKNTTRVRLIKTKNGIKSTAHIMELAKDMGRKRGDMYEICIWEDSIKIKDNTLYYLQAVHQESNVVPENIDAVRAIFDLASKEKSIKMTNKSLGII
jgi:glyceraldehyde-3-phosphate dehydrogenase (NAD(P))